MFDIGWSELLVIGIVALVVIGPKELPGVLRAIGQMMGKVRRMASEFQGQFNEAMREAELEDLRKQAEKLNMTVNPLEGVQDAITKPIEDTAKDLQAPLDAPKTAAAATPAPVPMDEIKPAEAVTSAPQPKSSGGSA
jgi:sec-independent protein translocase protein TatB